MLVQQNVELCDHRKVGQVDIPFCETGMLSHAKNLSLRMILDRDAFHKAIIVRVKLDTLFRCTTACIQYRKSGRIKIQIFKK